MNPTKLPKLHNRLSVSQAKKRKEKIAAKRAAKA